MVAARKLLIGINVLGWIECIASQDCDTCGTNIFHKNSIDSTRGNREMGSIAILVKGDIGLLNVRQNECKIVIMG